MEIHLALKISEKNFRKIFQKKSPKNSHKNSQKRPKIWPVKNVENRVGQK